MEFRMPPRLYNQSGRLRRVGFEIEFGGLSLEEAAQVIVQLHGGEIERKHHFSYKIRGSQLGDFDVESDSRFLSQKKYDQYLSKMGIPSDSSFNENVERFLERFAGTLLPFEIAMPPISLDHLDEAEKIREALYRHSAQGVSSSVFAAFGMQMNPEVPDFQVGTLLSYLRAFFLLYDWLAEQSEITLARRVAPFIHPFPLGYVHFVLQPQYRPNAVEFMRDYLEWNSTRNRPLDLLPLLSYLDRDLVFQYPVETQLVKPRPTFHYRLPNSEIDDPTWSLAKEWNKWVKVEQLASHPEKIRDMSQDFLSLHENHVFAKTPWIDRTREWMDVVL